MRTNIDAAFSALSPVRTPDVGLYEMYRLIDAGRFDLNAYDIFGRTLLYRATELNLPDAVDFLLSRGADPNVGSHRKCVYPVWSSRRECELLVMEGSGVSAADALRAIVSLASVSLRKRLFSQTYYPLHLAAEYGHIEIIESLISCGADAMLMQNGETAIDIARRSGKYDSKDIVSLLESKSLRDRLAKRVRRNPDHDHALSL